MAWIESHAELRDHPKTDLLMEVLGVTRRDAIGLLHMIWWRALTYAPNGDLSEFTDGQIARWAEWEHDPAALVSGLQRAGFMENDRGLHDWHDYAGRIIERREANAERMRQARAARSTRRGGPPESDTRECAENVRRTVHARAGLPDRTGPDRTGPDRTGPDHPPPTPPASGKGSAAGAAVKQPRGGRPSREGRAPTKRPDSKVPTDTSAYFTGEYGQILAARSRTQHTSEEG